MRRMLIKHVGLAVLVIAGIPFAVSSPGHAAFWVVMGAVTLLMVPWIGVMTYFHTDIRRIDRERKRSANPS